MWIKKKKRVEKWLTGAREWRNRKIYKRLRGEFFASPVVRFNAFTVIDLSSIPGWGNKIPQATWCDQKGGEGNGYKLQL